MYEKSLELIFHTERGEVDIKDPGQRWSCPRYLSPKVRYLKVLSEDDPGLAQRRDHE